MTATALVAAMVLDAIFGEPRWLWSRLPHPAVLMGRLIGWADTTFNSGQHQRLCGTLVTAALVIAAAATGYLLSLAPLSPLVEVLVAAVLLAQRSLCDHVNAVTTGLSHSLDDGRAKVAMIVGRDTAEMTGPEIARAAIESAAENLSDGVIAPAFWFLLAGLPGLLVYKIVNTADSMIGYRTPRHLAFGWAAARLDDVLNWVPARLTALLIWAISGRPVSLRDLAADARQHRSPNAGWPEAAVAPALGVALSGPRRYDGTMRQFPFVNEGGRMDAGPEDIRAATRLLWRTWAATLALVALLALLPFA